MHTYIVQNLLYQCCRHYSVPLVPEIPGLQEFTGQVFHSHTYRTPDKYKGKSALVLGARASGVDLAVEIASVADKVTCFLCLIDCKPFCPLRRQCYTHSFL